MHGAATTLRRRLLGIGFIVLVIAGIGLSVASFNHTFRDFTTVSLETDKVGNQLGKKADVKARGLIIGYVSEIVQGEEGATLKLRLEPEKAELVPKSASARLLPKTLFGERFVSLEFDSADGPKLSEGDVIPQDRSETATELGESFEKLLPMLRAVQPQKLNSTLTAMSNALNGRGEDLGETMKELGAYFGELNPHLPELEENFAQLAEYSENLSDVAPDLVKVLDNFRTGSKTLVDKRQTLAELYGTMTRASQDLEAFLAANKNNIITLGKVSRGTLELLAKYSPEVPCVASQMAEALPTIDKALGKGTKTPGLRAKVVIEPNQEKYEPGQDEPAFDPSRNFGGYRGPWCVDPLHPEMPDPLPFPYKFLYLYDGSERQPDARSDLDDEGLPCDAVNTFGNRVPEAVSRECKPGTSPNDRNGGSAAAGNPVNTPEENALLGQLLSVQTGMDPASMPNWGSLLVGPLYRGAEVEIR
ncbi:MAG: MCE family protein [Actinophytocola sp.]|nr:MCE family protein [Actinophytocola sp.]